MTRQLVVGLVTGFLFGAVLAASAGYFQYDAWTQMSPPDQLVYVAGVSDAIQAIHDAIQAFGLASTADLVTNADACTNPLVLGDVYDIAKGAVTKHPEVSPAVAIFMELTDCSPAPSQPSQAPTHTTTGLLPWQRTPQ